MRQKGEPVELRTDRDAHSYMIKEFLPDYRRDNFIPFKITLQPLVTVNKPHKDAIDLAFESVEEDNPDVPNIAEYVVQEGDTLEKLALKFMGDMDKWEHIML